MIWKKYILTKLFIVIGIWGIFATPQIPDKLIYKGDTLFVYLRLPQKFYKADTEPIGQWESIFKVNLFGNKKTCNSTACGNGYQAKWEIIDNQLYLIGIYSCCYSQDSIKADLTLLFKEKVIDGKVKADWITGNIISQKGKILLYNHDMATGGIFEYELELHFEKGKLTKTILYDNRKSKQSEYSQNNEKLQKHIYSNINWNILPKQETPVRVVVQFSANENGIIDDVKVVSGYNKIYDQEAIRVIKTIPEWDIYCSKGKILRKLWYMPIFFSEENRKKYETINKQKK